MIPVKIGDGRGGTLSTIIMPPLLMKVTLRNVRHQRHHWPVVATVVAIIAITAMKSSRSASRIKKARTATQKSHCRSRRPFPRATSSWTTPTAITSSTYTLTTATMRSGDRMEKKARVSEYRPTDRHKVRQFNVCFNSDRRAVNNEYH